MAGTTNRVELYPFSAPQKLERPDGFNTAAVSVDFGVNAVRLLVKEGSDRELIAVGKPPGGECSTILTVAGDSWSSETPVFKLTVALLKLNSFPGMKSCSRISLPTRQPRLEHKSLRPRGQALARIPTRRWHKLRAIGCEWKYLDRLLRRRRVRKLWMDNSRGSCGSSCFNKVRREDLGL
jgi:hypothetical protein